ncbi:MAG: immunoglobulin domain-containing protein [Limisphaerales bacterium]
MKPLIKTLVMTGLTLFALLGGIVQGNSQVSLLVDPTQSWIGYVNVYALPSAGGGYEFGSPWGTGALTAYYDVATPPYSTVTLIANTNNYNPADSYWVNPDGSGNKTVDASYYVQNDTLAGQTLTFSGVCLTNTLVSPYTSTVFIKEFSQSYSLITSVVATPVGGQPFSITLATDPGTHIQYGFETIGPDANPNTVYSLGDVVYQVQYPPILLSALNGQAAVAGQNVTFTETPTGGAPFTYQWTLNGVNLVNSSHISGATGSVLTITNVTLADVGTYAVNVTNSEAASGSVSAQLVLIPLAQAETNLVIDPGFESGVLVADPATGWYSYGNASISSTNGWYFDSPSIPPDITVVDGSNCLEIASGGPDSYTGVYQDRPALPGQVYTASAWFLTPPAYTLDQIYGKTTCNLQVQFYDAGGNLLWDYESTPFDTNCPVGTWINFPVTNKYAADYVTLLGTGPSIVAPPGTASMRIQPGYVTPDAASGGDMYVDLVVVTLHEPVVVPMVSGSNIQLTFPTMFGPKYNVLYKANLTDATWQLLTQIPGDGTVKTVSDSIGAKGRFYIVNTQ